MPRWFESKGRYKGHISKLACRVAEFIAPAVGINDQIEINGHEGTVERTCDEWCCQAIGGVLQ
jgi:hypothetical protein